MMHFSEQQNKPVKHRLPLVLFDNSAWVFLWPIKVVTLSLSKKPRKLPFAMSLQRQSLQLFRVTERFWIRWISQKYTNELSCEDQYNH